MTPSNLIPPDTSPCNLLKCGFAPSCAEKKLACMAFMQFVESGKFSDDAVKMYPLPNKKIYKQIF